MGALSAVLAIPYRNIKESIERNRQQNKNQKEKRPATRSAPGSRAPSLYKAGAASSFDNKKNKLKRGRGRGYSEGAEATSQPLGYLPLPLVDVPWAAGAEEKGEGKGDRRTLYPVEDAGAQGFRVGTCCGADIGSGISSRVSHRVLPADSSLRPTRGSGLARKLKGGIFGAFAETETGRRGLHLHCSAAVWNSSGKRNRLASGGIDIGTADKMASDDDYMAFLDKANEDLGAGTLNAAGGGEKVEFKTVDDGVDVPGVLVRATRDAWYVSDADEPFVVVALKHEGGLPDEETFARLIAHPDPAGAAGDIQILDVGEWDPHGQYQDLVSAVREAGRGEDVRVYRVPGEGSRVEYWMVGVEGGRLVGVKALGVES
ncbi:hypothetical protein DSL72_002883 [Monilinia vaccinii-corymbosi]|uniref:Uncharacterized protein n=1 Tax=Monilinia vaccinii-corymbosi TaxID=61207 RepID=A0A8A3PDZ0_9HELO|nr:hypothetical protein DSL72_002883 [Monilinia vaccinii-corymbosi]